MGGHDCRTLLTLLYLIHSKSHFSSSHLHSCRMRCQLKPHPPPRLPRLAPLPPQPQPQGRAAQLRPRLQGREAQRKPLPRRPGSSLRVPLPRGCRPPGLLQSGGLQLQQPPPYLRGPPLQPPRVRHSPSPWSTPPHPRSRAPARSHAPGGPHGSRSHKQSPSHSCR